MNNMWSKEKYLFLQYCLPFFFCLRFSLFSPPDNDYLLLLDFKYLLLLDFKYLLLLDCKYLLLLDCKYLLLLDCNSLLPLRRLGSQLSSWLR